MNFLIDAHVHLHECFPVSAFLHSALSNFTEARRKLGLSSDSSDYLLLCEPEGEDYLSRLRAFASEQSGLWELSETHEESVLLAHHKEEGILILVAGKQLRTSDGIEVLALGSRDGELRPGSLDSLVDSIGELGAIPVIPWGFGKWMLKRKQLLIQFLRSKEDRIFFMGDTRRRLKTKYPPMFGIAKSLGVPVLPGSDAFPFPGHIKEAGSYGFLLEDEFDEGRPFRSLKSALARAKGQPIIYGETDGLVRSFLCQIRIHYQNRFHSLLSGTKP